MNEIGYLQRTERMFQATDYTSLSLALSEALSEAGINEVIVSKRRRSMLLIETMRNMALRMEGMDGSSYFFGSQSEGTTTIGMESDFDFLGSLNDVNVIAEWHEWKPGVNNFLMVYNETTTPGYCMLQSLKNDEPLPETEIINSHHVKDTQGRILFMNTGITSVKADGSEQHGPAFSEPSRLGKSATDTVLAFKSSSLLLPVRQRLFQLQGDWPTVEMKRYIANSACFVVPVGGKGSMSEKLEWRISTSLAERCLMFSLNVTQLQVYSLLKMLLKTVINYNVPEENQISSFICKTVLMHCIYHSGYESWQSYRLLPCLQYCLYMLYSCVLNESCPHFIITSNNLMARKFTRQSKYILHENLQFLLQDIVSNGIMTIHNDNIANRTVGVLSQRMSGLHCSLDDQTCKKINFNLLVNVASRVKGTKNVILFNLKNMSSEEQIGSLKQHLIFLYRKLRYGNSIERLACKLLIPDLCSTVGSLLASSSIQYSNTVSPESLNVFSLGQNSDVASNKLKLASAMYSIGDINRVETILRDVENRYDLNACEPVCACYAFPAIYVRSRIEACAAAMPEDIPELTSSCVIFIPNERNCIPIELQYEMYRSTPDDLPYRSPGDYWMDWAVVDSLPYLHFLQYKVYSQLQRHADRQRALDNLMLAIEREPNLGHRETALNMLGQCLEQENRFNEVLKCYSMSLNIRARNNVAKFHLWRLAYTCMSAVH